MLALTVSIGVCRCLALMSMESTCSQFTQPRYTIHTLWAYVFLIHKINVTVLTSSINCVTCLVMVVSYWLCGSVLWHSDNDRTVLWYISQNACPSIYGTHTHKEKRWLTTQYLILIVNLIESREFWMHTLQFWEMPMRSLTRSLLVRQQPKGKALPFNMNSATQWARGAGRTKVRRRRKWTQANPTLPGRVCLCLIPSSRDPRHQLLDAFQEVSAQQL